MHNTEIRVFVGACAVGLISGCATTTDRVPFDAGIERVEPVYRVEQPAGTAAGQYAVGRMDLAGGRIGAAIERFLNALKLDPVFVEAYNGLGVAYGQQGRFEESAEAFRHALVSGPASAHVLSNLGYAQMKAGQLHEAWESFARSIELDPKNQRTRENVRILAKLQRRGAPGVASAAMPPTAEKAGSSSRAGSDSPVPTAVVVQSVPVRSVRPEQGDATGTDASVDAPSKAVGSPMSVVLERAQALAASFLARTAMKPSSFEVVPPTANGSKLVRVASSVYELRPAERPVAHASVPTVPMTQEGRAQTGSATGQVRPDAARAALGGLADLEVSNGAGVSRLATRTAQRFERLGAKIKHVTNYATFDRKRTEIHYRSGFAEEAKLVEASLPIDAELVAVERLRPGVNVRLVVGNDIATGNLAWWDSKSELARGEGNGNSRPL